MSAGDHLIIKLLVSAITFLNPQYVHKITFEGYKWSKLYIFQVMVKKLELEIEALKRELAMHDTLTNRSQIIYEPLSEQQRYDIMSQVSNYVEGNQDEIDVSMIVSLYKLNINISAHCCIQRG